MENIKANKKVRCLTELELVILLSAIAKEHCIIETRESHIDRLITDVHLVSIWLLARGALTSSKGSSSSPQSFVCRSPHFALYFYRGV